MSIHVNTFIQCETQTPGLCVRIANPYVRVRKTVHARQRMSAFSLVWFGFESKEDCFVLVDPRRPTPWSDMSDTGLRELHEELQKLPGGPSRQAQWFFLSQPQRENTVSWNDVLIKQLVVQGQSIECLPKMTLSMWADQKGIDLKEAVLPLTLVYEGIIP